MIRIMFVCHGNICRSPMAEFIMKDMIVKRGITDDFIVASSATSTEEIYRGVGNPVYPAAKAELASHGITCDGKHAVRLTVDDVDKFDYFVGMDEANIRNIHSILGDKAKGKVYKLLEFTHSDRDVVDPWYSDRFDVAYSNVYEGCKALLDFLLELVKGSAEK